MKINLSDIPEEGKSYNWSSQTGELNKSLKDLIGNNAYIADFTIKPLNSRDFEMRGRIETKSPEECSRCSLDFQFPIHEVFYEILIPRQENPRNSKYAKVNHVSDTAADEFGPGVSEYDHLNFEMGDFLHEIVGLAVPFNPAGPEDNQGKCVVCHKMVRGCSFSYDEPMTADLSEINKNPFEVLKNIKL